MVYNQLLRKYTFLKKSLVVFVKYKLKSPVPFLVILVPTIQCNLSCKYCEFYQDYKKIDSKRIPTDLMRIIINDIASMGVPMVSFSGGEPLLSADVPDIIRYAHEKGIIVNLNTNGTLINRDISYKLARYCDYIRISIDGCQRDHEKITGVRGSYDKTMTALQLLMKCPNKVAKIGINVVYNQGEEKRIEKTIRKFKSRVDFISILPRFSFTQNENNQREKVSTELQNIVRENMDIISDPYFIIDANTIGSKEYCDYGRLYVTVYPNGMVMGCPFTTKDEHKEYALGNINNRTFQKIIEESTAERSPNCIGCYATCTTNISRSFNSYRYLFSQGLSYFKQYLR